MPTVTLRNVDITAVASAYPIIASLAPLAATAGGAADPTTGANYGRFPSVQVGGFGFVYDQLGRLSGGTITSLSVSTPTVTNGIGPNQSTSAAILNTSIPVALLLQLYGSGQQVLPALLGQPNVYNAQSSQVTGSQSNDFINVLGPSTNYIPGAPGSPTNPNAVTVEGGDGQNTAAFADLRSTATIGNVGHFSSGVPFETATVPNITASLLSIGSIQFQDGTTLMDAGSVSGQDVLAFEGVFGRTPDAINAGGFGLLAQQTGLANAASTMLATTEGGNDTAALSNTQFVTSLYNDILDRAPDSAGLNGWVNGLIDGSLSRGGVVAGIAASPEAYSTSSASFATTQVFAANPDAVDVLRTYEVLLGRTPEAASLIANTQALDAGATSLMQLYASVQSSPEFAARGPNAYGVTSGSSYGSVYAATHSDMATATVLPLVTSQGVAHQ